MAVPMGSTSPEVSIRLGSVSTSLQMPYDFDINSVVVTLNCYVVVLNSLLNSR